MLKIINPKNNLSKTIDITRYSAKDINKTIEFYLNANFKVIYYGF